MARWYQSTSKHHGIYFHNKDAPFQVLVKVVLFFFLTIENKQTKQKLCFPLLILAHE